MTRVCMVVYHYYYRDSRIRRYVESLANSGVAVDVLCLEESGQPQQPAAPGVRLIILPVARASGGASAFLLAFAPALLVFATRLLVLHVRHRYDVIHVHNMPDALVFAALLPRLLGARVILDIHDPMPEFYASKYPGQSRSWKVQLVETQERLSCAVANAIITANTNFRDNLAARGIPAERITVIRNLPDPQVFDRQAYVHLQPDNRSFTMIYAGTIASRYGLHVAIKAMPQILAAAPSARLVIIGAGQPAYLEELRDLAHHEGVADAIRLLPPVPVHQVPAELAQADVGIYPALPDPHMEIATPSKVMEYATMGLPIIASRLRVLEDLLGEGAVRFCQPGDPRAFAEAALELARSPVHRQSLVTRADEVFVLPCHWLNEFQRYEELLRELLLSKVEVEVKAQSRHQTIRRRKREKIP